MTEYAERPDSGDLSQKVVALAAGEAHTLALTGDGSVYSWGRGTFGRLGTGKEDDELFPVPIEFDSSEGGKPKFVGIAAGAYHSLALQVDSVPSVEVPDVAKDELSRLFSLHRIVYDLSFPKSIVPWVLEKVRHPRINCISSAIFVVGAGSAGQPDVEDNFSTDFEATFGPATDGPMLSDLAGGLLHIDDLLGVTQQTDVAGTSGSDGSAKHTLVLEEGLDDVPGAIPRDYEQVPLHRNGSQGPLIDHAVKVASEQDSLDQVVAFGRWFWK